MPRPTIEPAIITKLATIVGVSESEFEVKDVCVDRGLYLIHYDADKIRASSKDSKARELRGTIIDINNEKVVCSSFGYIPTAVINDTDNIKGIFKNNEVLIDCDKNEYKLDTFEEGYVSILQKPEFTYDVFPLYEGTMIRVWKHNNELLISTHKKIDCANSHWGSSDTFKKLFLEYTQGYDLSSVTNEDTVHYFVLMDSDLLVSSKFPMNNKKGLVVYCGTNGNSWELIDKLSLPHLDNEAVASSDKTLFSPALLFKYSDVSKLLTQGFYGFPEVEQNSPLCLGEGVVISFNEGGKRKLIRVVSSAYKRRSELVDNDPNVLHRCYTLMTKTLYPKSGDDDYLTHFPSIPVMTNEEIENLKEPIIEGSLPGTVLTTEQLTDKSNKDSYDNRIRNTITWYAMSLPIPHQLEAFNTIKYMFEEREKIIKIVSDNFERMKGGDFEGLALKKDAGTINHIKHRLLEAEKFAQSNLKNPDSKIALQKMIMKNIRTGILRDTGEWVFKMGRLLISDRY
jgi:hypothetical protein